MNNIWPFLIILCLFISSCQKSFQDIEYDRIKQSNGIREVIYRLDAEHLLTLEEPQMLSRSAYPWEHLVRSSYPKITKEFFRCKGTNDHHSYVIANKERLYDCHGSDRHSLPLYDGEEFVYPVLMDILNYIQETFDHKVVVTCGHCCPQHNRWSDPSEYNRTSKHMIGAEVDFYVEGMERQTDQVIEAIKAFYQQDDEFKGNKEFTQFQRYQKGDTNVSTNPWYNKEIFVKLFKSHEGRDPDNSHPYPYFSIQVRHDREKNEKVTYTWQQAFYSYHRY